MTILLRLGLALAILTFAHSAFAKPINAVLRLKERVSMEELAADVQNPRSAHFRIPYDSREILVLSGPSDADYKTLIDQIKAKGLKILRESPTHLWISVSGEPAQYMHMPNLIDTTSYGDKPNTPTLAVFRPKFAVAHADLKSPQTTVPMSTVRSLYGFDNMYRMGLSGKGQHIAIATYGGFKIQNVRRYFSELKISPAPVVDQVNFNGVADYDPDPATETEMDAELSGMIAPGANIHVFPSAENSPFGELSMFTAILDDDRIKVVNYSWGMCEAYVSPEMLKESSKIFARAVAQGVNIMVASGDSGSSGCNNKVPVADWPSASNYTVAVGGTTVTVVNGGLYETGWMGSGGGISKIVPLPAWQSKLGAPFFMRSVPDVAFNADPRSGEPIWTMIPDPKIMGKYKAGWRSLGGTSMAAPQWSGFLAMVGEARNARGKDPIGYINPIIYDMTADAKALGFHDITFGANGAFANRKSWDAVTGWGSMQADVLLNYLIQ